MSCKKCGACCKTGFDLELEELEKDKEWKEYLKARGCTINGNRVHIPQRCENLNKDNTCAIYEKRPKICREFKGETKGKDKMEYIVPKECKYGT